MSRSPFHVKICGVTRIEDAYAVQSAGGDAIGLNFYPKSKRFLSPDDAFELVNEFRGQSTRESYQACAYQVPKIVGVFVNASIQEILDVHQQISLDGIQLHGDETLEYAKDLIAQIESSSRPKLIRAIHTKRLDDSAQIDVAGLTETINQWQNVGTDAALLDAFEPGQYGGTGQAIDWHAARVLADTVNLPLVLAGGLHPSNVADAIRISGITSVDVASGVETSPGIKDAAAAVEFVHNSVVAIAEYPPK